MQSSKDNFWSNLGHDSAKKCCLNSSSAKVVGSFGGILNSGWFWFSGTESSGIVGIPTPANLGFLGIIHKRLVDFLALIRIDQTLTSPSLVDIPPVFVFVQSLRQALLILVLLVTENGHRVFLWVPQQFLMPAAPCNDRRWVV